MACDFACVDTVGLRRYYLLFFIDISTRRVFHAGITAHPTGEWTTQAARNLFLRHSDALAGCKALVRDRGSQGELNWSSQHLDRGGARKPAGTGRSRRS